MTALMLTALFAAVALLSMITIADALVRSRNAFRLLRGELARVGTVRQVTVRYAGEAEPLPLPPLRSLTITASRRMRRTNRRAEPVRAAA